jgi:hypothetical protein
MTLYEAGKDALEKEFRNLLQRHGKPVPAGSLLDVLVEEGKLILHRSRCKSYMQTVEI